MVKKIHCAVNLPSSIAKSPSTLFFSLHPRSIGIEGAVLVDVMQDKGVSIPKMEAYIQRLRRGDGASCAEVVCPRLLDFWKVKEKGALWKRRRELQ